jgi:RHS repeat-associated protein
MAPVTCRISRPADNVILWRWDSEPFGTAAANQDPDGDGNQFVYNPRFPGQYFDAETELNYNYARDYDPATGRYIQADPLGLAGGSYTTYAYADGNAISEIDPLGLWSVKGSAYAGWGGSVTLGYDNGQFFVRAGLGVGLGGGVKVYPQGNFPTSPSGGCGCGSHAFIGSSGSLSASFGPASVEYKAQAGGVVTQDCNGKPKMEYVENSKFDWSLRGKTGWGLSLGGGLNIVDIGVAP